MVDLGLDGLINAVEGALGCREHVIPQMDPKVLDRFLAGDEADAGQ